MGCNASKEVEVESVHDNADSTSKKSADSTPTFYHGAKLFDRNDFTIEKFVQEGGQGKVYIGRENKTQKKFALKVSYTSASS